MTRRLGYLSGAPRVSTRPEAEASGPKTHVLGVIGAFEALGWEVYPFIVGDRVPLSWIRGSERQLESSFSKRFVADVVRIFMGKVNAYRAWHELGDRIDWAYERFAAFQALGYPFRRRGIPWILETNAPTFYEAKSERKSIVLSSLAKSHEIQAYRSCDVLVTVTEALKDIIVQEAKIDPDKVIVIPNGVDTYRFDPAKAIPKRLYKGPTLGFVGSLIAWQALDRLIQALVELRQEGVYWNLVVVGDGPKKEEWQALVHQLGLEKHVHFVGRVPWDEVPSWIMGFDFGYSGQVELEIGEMYLSPLKLYEYMAMGRPVIASAFEDARRVIQDGKTGYLFDPKSLDSLKAVLRRAWHEREAWIKMGEAARDRVVREDSWEARVRKLIYEVEAILRDNQRKRK